MQNQIDRDGLIFFRDYGDGYLRTENKYSASDVVDALRSRGDGPLNRPCHNRLTMQDIGVWVALQKEAIRIVRPVDTYELVRKLSKIMIDTMAANG
jgi:hypothetical protein